MKYKKANQNTSISMLVHLYQVMSHLIIIDAEALHAYSPEGM